jgi:hypothetical protein
MKPFLKVIAAVAGSVGLCLVLFPLAGTSENQLLGSQSTVGG